MTVSRLDLYDIADGKPVLLDAAATGASARGNFVWWSTGDNETLAWHGLDLRTLR
jgi:membrane-bound inhibitor of C-type lysozyme